MTTRQQSPSPAPRSLRIALGPLHWLERARGRRRWVLAAAYLVAFGALAALFRYATCLSGLPDVGVPFDLASFRRAEIPEDRDAFALYRRAAREVRTGALEGSDEGRTLSARMTWSELGSAARRWIEDNRDGALATWRRGTERPDAQAFRPRIEDADYEPIDRFRWFTRMALPEGSRLEARGDMAVAWGWYLAVHRSIGHLSLRSRSFDRRLARLSRPPLESAVSRWAADPRTDTALIARALDDATASEAMESSVPDAISDVYTLRLEALLAEEWLDQAIEEHRAKGFVGSETDWSLRIAIPGVGELGQLPLWAHCVLGREEERSRRVVRLAYANWLAAAESGRLDDPPAAEAVAGEGPNRQVIAFFDAGPDARPASRALGPAELARWCDSTVLARPILADLWDTFATERKLRRPGRKRLSAILADALAERRRAGPQSPLDQPGNPPALPDETQR